MRRLMKYYFGTIAHTIDPGWIRYKAIMDKIVEKQILT
jgi:hypothetical protein